MSYKFSFAAKIEVVEDIFFRLKKSDLQKSINENQDLK
jgi:hypothetical protein